MGRARAGFKHTEPSLGWGRSWDGVRIAVDVWVRVVKVGAGARIGLELELAPADWR